MPKRDRRPARRSSLSRVPGSEGRALRERFSGLKTALKEVDASLARAEDGSARQEALRRARLRILWDMEALLKSPSVAGRRPPPFSAGPKGGIYTVRQGGSPGLGKRR